MTKETKFNVGMTCEGCASAVKRILGKVDGVQSVDTDVDAKTVVVHADDSVSPQLLLEKLEKVRVARDIHAINIAALSSIVLCSLYCHPFAASSKKDRQP